MNAKKVYFLNVVNESTTRMIFGLLLTRSLLMMLTVQQDVKFGFCERLGTYHFKIMDNKNHKMPSKVDDQTIKGQGSPIFTGYAFPPSKYVRRTSLPYRKYDE